MKRLIYIIILLTNLTFPQEFKFGWLTDIHIGYPTSKDDLIRSVNDINSFNDIDFIIVSGDITATGTLAELKDAKIILDNLKKPYYIIPGNHDTKWSESGCTDFIKLWGSDRFVFNYEKFLFIGLHEGPRMKMADGYFAPEDLRWFDSVTVNIHDHNQPIIFVTHYPLDESIANWYEMTNRLTKLNVKVVLFGHGHQNKIFNFDGLQGIECRSNLSSQNDGGGYNIVKVSSDSVYYYERIPKLNITNHWASTPINLISNRIKDEKIKLPDYSINQNYPFVKTVWQFNTGYTIGSSAVINDSSVFVADASGKIYSLNINDGSLNWSFNSKNAIYSTPAIYNNFLVFGSTDSCIYTLDSENGELKWKFKTNAAVLGCPVIDDNKVFIGGSDRIFRAIELTSGKLIWEFSGLNGFVETKPIIYDDKILFGAWDENFYCLDSKTGELIWKWKGDKPGIFYSPAACWPVTSNGIVIFAAPDRKLTAIDIQSGKQLWRTGIYQVRETVGLSEDGRKLFARTMNDTILALPVSKQLEKPLWITNCGFGYDISSAQIVEKDRRVFYPTKNGVIYSLDAQTGKINWQYKITNGYINTITPIDDNNIIATDFDGNITLIKFNKPE